MPYKPSDLFSCRKCGQCCKGYGGTFVTEQEARAIADYLNESLRDIVCKYCLRSGKRLILTQQADGYCVFYDSGCRIHPVKPPMCKKWPFIESVLRDIANWQAMARSCPGMKADVPEAAIRACVKQELNRKKSGSVERST